MDSTGLKTEGARFTLLPRRASPRGLLSRLKLTDCISGVDIIVPHGWRVVPEWNASGLPVYEERQFADPAFQDSSYDSEVDSDYERLLCDPMIWLLGERLGWVDPKRTGPMIGSMNLLFLVRNIHAYIRSRNIMGGIFVNVPHKMFEYVFYRVLESKGLRALYCHESPLRGYYWLMEGIENPRPWHLNDGLRGERDAEGLVLPGAVDHMIDTIRQSYDVGMPDYMRITKGAGAYDAMPPGPDTHTKDLSPAGKLASKAKKYLRLIKKSGYRHDLANTYKSLARQEPAKPYIYLALHTQPEATTLPRAGKYIQQMRIVETLRAAANSEFTIAVREHPDTFNKPYGIKRIEKVRTKRFYTALAGLPNVELVAMDRDPFDLIDNSFAVATATGVVGTEAVIRGKPVLAFGGAQYLTCPGVYHLQGIEDCRRAIEKIRYDPGVGIDDVKAYLSWVEQHAVAGTNQLGTRGDRYTVFPFYVSVVLRSMLAPDQTHDQPDSIGMQ